MKICFFSTKPYDQRFFQAVNRDAGHELVFYETKLTADTASLAKGCDAVCVFVNDPLGAATLEALADQGCELVLLRCAGYNNVDLDAADRLGITVCRVPVYSPFAVAEHTLALILTLNRKVHKAYNRVRDGNFAIDGLIGFDLNDKTIGIVGTGRIGQILAKIAKGLGMHVLAYDLNPNAELEATGVAYVPFDDLIEKSDIVSLLCPLTPKTHHLISTDAVEKMKPGVMLVNTSRGGLIDASALIGGLKSGRIGSVALDVYEEEGDVFFEDLSDQVLQDDTLARLLTFPNVLITSHQAFFTKEAMHEIASTTLANATAFAEGNADQANRVTR
ncbi:MAG: 2-hydroxyacid dehydrogenase [Phycisphaeraceae bacterium]